MPAGDEAMDDARAARPAGSDGPEDGAFDRPSGGAPAAPQSVQAEPSPADAAHTAETRPGGEAPLITAVEIENFKGIGRPVRIELRPITLLFGRNSAGKSTVLHALCYAHEILSHGNVDAHKTDLGGDRIDLGGFRRFVHGCDLKRAVRLRFELNLRDRELPELAGRIAPAPHLSELWDDPGGTETGWTSLTVRWCEQRNEPILSDYEVGVDGNVVGRITASVGDAEADLQVRAELGHPLLRPYLSAQLEALEEQFEQKKTMPAKLEVPQKKYRALEPSSIGQVCVGLFQKHSSGVLPSSGALPSFGHHLHMDLEEWWIQERDDYGQFWFHVSTLLVGIGGLLRDALDRHRYVGPVRDLHPAAGGERGRSGLRRWADGSAAWDLLTRGPIRPGFIDEVNEWLSQQDRLDTGCALRVRSAVLQEIRDETPGDILKATSSDSMAASADQIANAPVQREIQIEIVNSGLRVRTSDVGVGVSQVVPVVVAVLDPDRPGITAIEQPELHVHPRLQVELGDLLAQQAAGGKVFLIETHSEHLMLRLLRRIEETRGNELPAGKPALTPDQVSVVYVEQVDGEVRATRLRVDETGEFIDRWPQGFFDERDEELF